MTLIYSLIAGVLFGAGLTISDMVNPDRVLNFLDFAGAWDPTLAFVMAGGLLVTGLGYRFTFLRAAPFHGNEFVLPSKRDVDRPLLGGAATFGLGWGLVGICPGPALTALFTLNSNVILFVVAMLVGMYGTNLVRNNRRQIPLSI